MIIKKVGRRMKDKGKEQARIRRYQVKAQTRLNLVLHNITDAELIDYINKEGEKGYSPTEVVRNMYRKIK